MHTQSFSNGADSVIVRSDGDYSLAFLGGDDTLTVNGGTNTSATMGDGRDYVRLISGLATVDGQSGSDRFDIWASGVTAYGGAGDDLFTLRAGAGQLVYGDDGNDRVNFTASVSNVTADLGTGNDAFIGYGSAVSGSL